MPSPIAIVGLACRYPDANSPRELWENVLAGRRAFRRLPDARLNQADYVSAESDAPDTTYVTQAAVLADYEFDRLSFRVAGSTYRAADPAHWLALDVAAQALADAGFAQGSGLPAETTGVIVGNTLTGEFSRAALMRLRWPYVRRVVAAALARQGWDEARQQRFLHELEGQYKQPFEPVGAETLAGGLSNTIAGRICNYFDLKGGGYTVDGACASSLLAVNTACSNLAAGDLDVALVGGVDLSLDPFELVGFARTGALARDAMRVYDVRSAGFWPGEGCGFAVLMRYDDAAAQGRRIYAVIRGWGVSSDGNGGITRPEADGQILALQRAYRRAGLDIGSVAYFEGHGTGTQVGDATELETLGRARSSGQAGTPAVIGSIKAIIGHTKAAAGMAGLIKATLAVHEQIIPPTTGCERPHPRLATPGARLSILPQGQLWRGDYPLRAGVSAMGFGGINTHVVLENSALERRTALTPEEAQLLHTPQDAELFVLGGEDSADLQRQINQLLERVPHLSLAELTDLAAHLARHIQAPHLRAAIVASAPAELIARLRAVLNWLQTGLTTWIDADAGVFLGAGANPPRIGYLFPGQASPANLSGGLWARRFQATTPTLPDTGDSVDTAIAQPAIVRASLMGLVALQRAGVQAVAAVGHSLGELTALHWAGALEAGALLELAQVRGAAMSRLGQPTGAMLSISANRQTVEWLVNGSPVVIACYNSPQQTIISGEAAAVSAVAERAQAQQMAVTRLPVSHAFHSPLVAAAVGPLADYLAQCAFKPLQRRLISTVTGADAPPDVDIRALLTRQITAPVRFTQALNRLIEEVDVLIEVGPGRVLGGLARPVTHLPIISLEAGGESLTGWLKAVGAAYALGAPVPTADLFADRFTRPFDLAHQPTFLTNPCELAPTLPALSADFAPTPAAAAPEQAAALLAPAEADAITPRQLVRQLVAERAELPLSVVQDSDRLLSDLHLNSITVGQIVGEAARRLGLTPPVAPTSYADVTVAMLAESLGERLELGDTAAAIAPPGSPAGVETWIRSFAQVWLAQPAPRPLLQPGAGRWQVYGLGPTALATALAERLVGYSRRGCVVCLPGQVEEAQLNQVLAWARRVAAENLDYFILAQEGEGSGAAAAARTLHLERPETITGVITLPPGHPTAADWVVEEIRAAQGHVEARYTADGRRFTPAWRPVAGADAPDSDDDLTWLSASDVLVVSGGGKGITAECVLALGRRSGVRLALLGQSQPERDAELAANLQRCAEAGVTAVYYVCDVTQPDAVVACLTRIEADLGPITGIIHGAARNVPRLIGQLSEADVRGAFAPKVDGLRHLLAAARPEQLRLVATFGSIIGRTGLNGEAHYALANAAQTDLLEQFQAEHPACRCLNVEWSIWAEVGMGARLGRIDILAHNGITPIPPTVGVATWLRLLARRQTTPVSVVVMGRYGNIPTLPLEPPELPVWRFLEEPRLYYPDVELIADFRLSPDTDLYLAEHVVQGEIIFPGVIGLEAITQAAMALAHSQQPPHLEDVVFQRPIVVPRGQPLTVRVAALVQPGGEVSVVLRSAETAFQVDHFRATCRFPADENGYRPIPALDQPLPEDVQLPPVGLTPATDLYGAVMFQGRRFQKVRAYRHLTAFECVAEIDAAGRADWFSHFLPRQQVLGDPGARDAFIHAIQACIPHATLLPISVAQIVCQAGAHVGPYSLHARQRAQTGPTYIYDLVVRDAQGALVESWHGLHLRSVHTQQSQAAWAPALLGPYVERRIRELLPQANLTVAVEAADGPRRERSNQAVQRALGKLALVRRRTDGKPEINGGQHVSTAHAGALTLAVVSPGLISCDVEPVQTRPPAVWQGLLGPDYYALINGLAQMAHEEGDLSATRLWAIKECLIKAGQCAADAPLLFTTAAEDGWVLGLAGALTVATTCLRVAGWEQPLALAVLLAEPLRSS